MFTKNDMEGGSGEIYIYIYVQAGKFPFWPRFRYIAEATRMLSLHLSLLCLPLC